MFTACFSFSGPPFSTSSVLAICTRLNAGRLVPGRKQDTMGLAYFHLGVSDELKGSLSNLSGFSPSYRPKVGVGTVGATGPIRPVVDFIPSIILWFFNYRKVQSNFYFY